MSPGSIRRLAAWFLRASQRHRGGTRVHRLVTDVCLLLHELAQVLDETGIDL